MPQIIDFDDTDEWRAINRSKSSKKLVQLINCRTVRESSNGDVHLVDDDHVWFENGRILNAERNFFDCRRIADVQIDCGNRIVAAGYIDVQVNGACRVDFSSHANANRRESRVVDEDGLTTTTDDISSFNAHDYADGVRRVSRHLLSHGITAYCPTLISSTPSVYARVLPHLCRSAGSAVRGASVIGAHCEGPFITHPGCHPTNNLRNTSVTPADLDLVYGRHNWTDASTMAMVTLAPDVTHASTAIEALVDSGVVVSLGHTRANFEQAESGVRHGARAVTHLYNAMNVYHHREAGMLGLLASECVPRTVFYGLITDGHHVNASAVRIAWRTNPLGLMIVSDAIAALGAGDGRMSLGGTEVEVVGMRATIVGDKQALAGAVAPIDHCVRNMHKYTKCRPEQAIACASLHPARMLQIADRKGSLMTGCDADLNILDDELNVLATIIGGELAFAQKSGYVENVQ